MSTALPALHRQHPDQADIQAGTVRRQPVTELPAGIAPVFERLGVAERLTPGGVPPHRHANHEVILVDMGTYRCRVNDTPMTLSPGQGVVVKPGDRHEDIFDGPVRYFGLCFNLAEDDQTPPPPIFLPGITPELQRFAVELESFWPVVCSIQREAEHPDPVSGHVQDALVLTFFWRMIRALPRAGVNPIFLDVSSGQTFPAQVLRLFQEHLDSDLSVAEMAARLSLSESTFAHRCADLLGLPPRKAFLKCKMERAQYLLCYTALPVKEIAALLGFADPFSFSRTFRKVWNESPSGWRRRHAR